MSTEGKSIDVSGIDPSLAEDLPFFVAKRYRLLPIYAAGASVVVITPDGQSDPDRLGKIGDIVKRRLVPYALENYTADEIETAIDCYYGNQRLRLGELLVLNEVISDEQLAEALRHQERAPERKIGEILRDLDYADESQIQELYAGQINYRYLSVNASLFLNLSMFEKLPEEFLREHRILPVPKGDSGDEVFLLSGRELDEELIGRVKGFLGIEETEPILTTESDLMDAIEDCSRRLKSIHARDKTLGSLLLERELITDGQLAEALLEQKATNAKLGELLVAKRVVPERAILEVLADQLGVQFAPELPRVIPPEFKGILTEKFAAFNKVVPVGREDGRLVIAMADPQDRQLLSMLQQVLTSEIRILLTSTRQIQLAIKRLFHNVDNGLSDRIDLKKPVELKVIKEDSSQYNTERIINTVNNILVEGVQRGASDVHITPEESTVNLFYRLDGNLVKFADLPIGDRDNIVTRVKIMSGMRIDVRHVPQSGRIVARVDNRHIDFRVSTLPTQFGENVVLRILDSKRLLDNDLSKLGLPRDIKNRFLEECERAQGIILVTGPTGSGKTTTLYHALNWLHTRYPHKGISTIENPIEYVVDGIVQSEVNEARRLTYASILKEKLRQDPDIIMVGEIRSLEEGQLAFAAALTGHLVFSTLHTNDGATTIRRLVDMGLEPYNISTAINCVLSQRLAKKICPRCKTSYTPTAREIRAIRRTYPNFDPDKHSFRVGWGCDFCSNGYKGRVGIFELLLVDAEVKRLISRKATDSRIRTAAVRAGMKTLRMAGLELAFRGVTTLEEVLSVTDIIH